MTNAKKILGAGILIVALILGVVAYSFLRPPAQATAPIEAIPLAATTPEPSTTDAPTEAALATTDTAATEAPTSVAEEITATSAPAATATEAAAVTEVTTAPASASSPILAQIVPEESEVRFLIYEVLNGAPKTVVGTTNQVAGELAVDPNDPTQTQVGVIQVNARTLTTDSEMRTRTIANRILETNQYEFITFTPTSLVGLPEQGSVGQAYKFQMVGDLTIKDVTKEVTFAVTATPQSETRLEGTATTTILYADYGITIPSVRQVASVEDEVRIEIDFVAATT